MTSEDITTGPGLSYERVEKLLKDTDISQGVKNILKKGHYGKAYTNAVSHGESPQNADAKAKLHATQLQTSNANAVRDLKVVNWAKANDLDEKFYPS